ncbi:metallophosphoesterase family protein [Streptomyces mangrovisoli]|uniref:Calcineurin-like phosphoesterase domain-containing protein n=1 Tax=Streptomyces mangrovisoli TaxID=1428628 RepID=A0A1J4P0A6_9ACTN|nr:metallophosphoesterase [Streptomyces mangrovisoli]OIJ68175.1 hypothetical protein WN71_009020 [Streptomyces mangrovisoli]
MGSRFDLSASAVVAHLLATDREPRRLEGYGMSDFLGAVSRGNLFTSSSRSFGDDLRDRANDSMRRLQREQNTSAVLSGSSVRRVLEPLTEVLSRYQVVVLPIGSADHQRQLNELAREAARGPGRGHLVLMPTLYEPKANARVLDPDEGVSDALKRRDEWPGAIFAVRGEASFFLPLEAACRTVTELSARDGEVRSVVRQARVESEHGAAAARRGRRRLLHLSDLHLGARQPNGLGQFLQYAVARFEPLDRVVITGDLFHQPRREHRQQYTQFESQLRKLTPVDPIVVPGNHDQRILGTRIGLLGRWRNQLADLRWNSGHVYDQNAGIVFLCFDSSRTGSAARGGIGNDQFVDVATGYDAAQQGASFDDCLRIAVLHHHPYPYPLAGEVPVIDSGSDRRRWSAVRERLLEMVDAEQFLAWCAARDVSLVLHGHRHRPRLVNDRIATGDRTRPEHSLLTVGCGASLGAGGGPLSFNVIDWNQATGSWSVDFQISENDARGFRSVAVQAASGRDVRDGRIRRAGRREEGRPYG